MFRWRFPETRGRCGLSCIRRWRAEAVCGDGAVDGDAE